MISTDYWPGWVKMTETRRDNCSASVIILVVRLAGSLGTFSELQPCFHLVSFFWKITVAWNLGDCNLPWNYIKKTLIDEPCQYLKHYQREDWSQRIIHFILFTLIDPWFLFFFFGWKLEYKTWEIRCFLFLTGEIQFDYQQKNLKKSFQ